MQPPPTPELASMGRRSFLATAAAAASIGGAGCIGRGRSGDAPVPTDWAMYRYDAANTGGVGTVPPDPRLAWSIDVGTTRDRTVADGMVYTAIRDSRLASVSATDGSLVWRDFDTRTTGSPLVQGPRLIVIDGANVVGIDRADGTEAWRFGLDQRPNFRPASTRDTVYVGTDRPPGFPDEHEPLLHALDTQTGEHRWTRPLPEYPSGGFTVDDDAVYLTVRERHEDEVRRVVRALNRFSGGDTWTAQVPDNEAVYTTPCLTDTAVVVGGRVRRDPPGARFVLLRAFDRQSGEPVWSFEDDGRIRATPAARGGLVYLGVEAGRYSYWVSGKLYAIDAGTGRLVWSVETEDPIRTGPIVTADTVVFAAGNLVFALDRWDGRPVWDQPLAFPAAIGTLTIHGDTLFVSAGDDILYAIR